MRECPFPGDGEFSWSRFTQVYNTDLANNLGNLLSRCLTLISKNYGGTLPDTAGRSSSPVVEGFDLPGCVRTVAAQMENWTYNQALQTILAEILTPTNQYLETHAPWKLVKTDKDAAKTVLFNAVQSLRIASILLKPFLPRSTETIYNAFTFPVPWSDVSYADAADPKPLAEDLRVTAALVEGKVKPLFPSIA
jgi:methionyl-tRNA synthetase